MPLDSQYGEVAERLRSFFRLRGRIPSQVDELVVPTAVVQQLDQPPWRTAQADWMGTAGVAPAAGEIGYVGAVAGFNLPLPPPEHYDDSVTVVRSVWIENSGAGAARFGLGLKTGMELMGAGFNQLSNATNVERLGLTVTTFDRLPVGMGRYVTVGADATVRTLATFRLPATSSLLIPLRVTLVQSRIGSVQSRALVVWNVATGVGVEAHFAGEWYPAAAPAS